MGNRFVSSINILHASNFRAVFQKFNLNKEVYLKSSQTSMMGFLAKIINNFQPLIISAKKVPSQMFNRFLNTPLTCLSFLLSNRHMLSQSFCCFIDSSRISFFILVLTLTITICIYLPIFTVAREAESRHEILKFSLIQVIMTGP